MGGDFVDVLAEDARLILRRGPRRIIGVPAFFNLLGSVKAAPARYIAGKALAAGLPLYVEDDRLRRALAAVCGSSCRFSSSREGAYVVDRAELVEAYYNTVANFVVSMAPGVDSLAVPCISGALGEAVARRAREVERGITVVAARLGEGDCGWADAVYGGPFDEVPVGGLDLGPASVSTLSAALKAAAELDLFSTIAILTDRRC